MYLRILANPQGYMVCVKKEQTNKQHSGNNLNDHQEMDG